MRDLKAHKQKKCKTNRRKQEKQARDWKKLFHRTLRVCIASGSGFLLASGALLTAQMLLESGYFGVKQVRVEHQVRVSEGDILDASDIEIGDSLFDLELHMIGRKIEEHAWIAKAEVERSFPDQVVIRVVEREARAIIDLDYLYYVDRAGEVFKMLDAGDELDYPVITGIDRQYLLDNPDKTQDSVNLALQLMEALVTTFDPATMPSLVLHTERSRLSRIWSEFFDDYPIVIGPTWTDIPFLHDADLDPDAGVSTTLNQIRFITPGNLLGIPAVALPMGVTNGLPTGIQIYADRWREDLCLRAAAQIDDEVGQICPIDPVS